MNLAFCGFLCHSVSFVSAQNEKAMLPHCRGLNRIDEATHTDLLCTVLPYALNYHQLKLVVIQFSHKYFVQKFFHLSWRAAFT